MAETTAFWRTLERLVAASEVVIDRPAGSAHPRYPEIRYPLDYGYLKGTHANDGDGVDVWLGASGSRAVVGVLNTVDLVKRDVEMKVLLGCTAQEIATILAFHNRGGNAALWLPR